MKGLAPLFLGIFGTFAFSWIGLTVIPTWQIGHLNPEADEEGTDIYPRPQSGMFARGELETAVPWFKKERSGSFHQWPPDVSASTGLRNVGTVDVRPNPKSIRPK